VEKMCEVLKVSRSGYYAWRKRPPSKRRKKDVEILKAIRKSYDESRKLYGVRKIHADIKKQFGCGRNRVYRLMKANGIYSIRPRKFKATTISKHNLPVAENLLNQNFSVSEPNKVWVSDISYIATDEGWLYLAAIKDLFNKEIVGWAMDSTMTKGLVIQALKQALKRHRPKAGAIHHSDRGVQYASHDYQKLLRENGFTTSMSRKGNCYDNAEAETFFGTLKNELIHLIRFKTRDGAVQAIFEYIEVFYNRKRRHASLSYLSPLEFKCDYLKNLTAQELNLGGSQGPAQPGRKSLPLTA
jgi:putative transposase